MKAFAYLAIVLSSQLVTAAGFDPSAPIPIAPAPKMPRGICPENAFRYQTPLRPYLRQTDFVANAQRDRDQLTALSASGAIYQLADFENSRSGQAMIDHLKGFVNHAVENYEIFQSFSEPQSGLKYAVFNPISEDRPWVLAISGTSSLLDAAVDLNLGQLQLTQLSRAIDLLTNCAVKDRRGFPLASKKWIITGHSLGGGLAQAVAYAVQSQRSKLGLTLLDLQMVSFNAFGAVPLIEKSETYNENVTATFSTDNFYVRNDAVSRIGHHVGTARQLTPRGEDPNSPEKLVGVKELGRRHSLDMIRKVVQANTAVLSGLATATVQSPTEFTSLNYLMFGTPVGEILAAAFDSQQKAWNIPDRFLNAVDILSKSESADPKVLGLLEVMISDRLEETNRVYKIVLPSPQPMRELEIQKYNLALQRLHQLKN